MNDTLRIDSPSAPSVALRRIHLDARLAFVAMMAFSVSLFLVESWAGMSVFALLLFLTLALMRPNLTSLAKCAAPLCLVLGFTVIAHLPQGLDEGLFYAVRILLLVFAMLTVAFSYDDTQFVRAFSALFSPLRSLHVPVDDLATIFSIAFRFIPLAMEEFRRIAKAQRARAAKLDDGPVIERIKRWGSVLAPMLISLFRKTGILAQAMESRCYGHAKIRTSLHGKATLKPLEITFALTASALCVLAGILL